MLYVSGLPAHGFFRMRAMHDSLAAGTPLEGLGREEKQGVRAAPE